MNLHNVVRSRRSDGSRPRVHPNGFLQLDLTNDGSERLHIWHPDLPRQKTYTGTHDHIFDMSSTVIKGRLWQVIKRYTLEHRTEPTHEVYMAQYTAKSQSKLEGTGVLVQQLPEYPGLVYVNQTYTQPAFTFHESRPGDEIVVTLMSKDRVYEGHPRVLVPLDRKPDNDFERENAPEDFLWEIIEANV